MIWEGSKSFYTVTDEGQLLRSYHRDWCDDYFTDIDVQVIAYYSKDKQRVVNMCPSEFTDDDIEQLYWQISLS